MQEIHPFIDVDGVLADFAGAAAKLHNYDIERWPLGTYDMVDVLGISDDEFWAPIYCIGADFWENLETLPWAMDLVGALPRFTLLTSPSGHPTEAHGKMAWIRRVFGSGFRDYMIGPNKHLCARHPGAVIVDDFPKNCERFVAAGGRAVLFPQRWNHRHEHHRNPLAVVLPEVLS